MASTTRPFVDKDNPRALLLEALASARGPRECPARPIVTTFAFLSYDTAAESTYIIKILSFRMNFGQIHSSSSSVALVVVDIGFPDCASTVRVQAPSIGFISLPLDCVVWLY